MREAAEEEAAELYDEMQRVSSELRPDASLEPAALQLVAGDDFTPFHVDNEGPAVYFKLCFAEVLVATWEGEEGESVGMVDGGGDTHALHEVCRL